MAITVVMGILDTVQIMVEGSETFWSEVSYFVRGSSDSCTINHVGIGFTQISSLSDSVITVSIF